MRKLTILLAFIFSATIVYSQNIGIGTNSPAASALLDITSTTKGMLMPRMTTAQRAAIPAPALGLLVFDTDTKTIWTHDGSAWKNLYTNGGLTLPYSQTVNTSPSAFQVTNQGTGAALDGSTSNEFGTGIYARSSGTYGWSLNSYSNRPGAVSVRSVADSGMAYYGENVYTGNTNTLMYLLNRGMAKTLQVQLTNTSSTSPNMQIAGNNLGEQLMVYQTNASNSSPAISIDNSGTGEGLYAVSDNGIGVSGTSSTGYGLKGVTNSSTGFAGVHGTNTGTAGSGVVGVSNAVNTQGVYGSSANGVGVRGLSNTYRAVQGISTSGTGLYGSSTSGLALEIAGNVKISGGSTNPSDGGVLTSDASGNAIWKKTKIAFRASGAHGLFNDVISNYESPLHYGHEDYDYGNNFSLLVGNGSPLNTDDVFTAPVAGLYHFNTEVYLLNNDNVGITQGIITLWLRRPGYINSVIQSKGHYIGTSTTSMILQVSGDIKMLAGDAVYVTLWQTSASSSVCSILDNSAYTFFSGHLAFAD